MFKINRLLALLVATLLTACASIPSGTSVMALPGSGKNFGQFRNDDHLCKQFAYEQVGGVTPNQSALASGATSAAIGTGLGAAAGALIGLGTGEEDKINALHELLMPFGITEMLRTGLVAMVRGRSNGQVSDNVGIEIVSNGSHTQH